jgi:molybdopterin synthase sulfur carrier subunit
MAHVFMKLPVGLTGASQPSRLECDGATVGEALADCVEKVPRLHTRVFREDGSLWVGVFLNGRNIRQIGGLQTPLSEGDELRVLPPIAGG